MILTGKALEDFTKWNGDRQFDMMLPFEYPIYLNALIIEWFDSVGIYADVYICHDNTFDFSINNATYNSFAKTRQEAIKQAIIKANEIYNERNII